MTPEDVEKQIQENMLGLIRIMDGQLQMKSPFGWEDVTAKFHDLMMGQVDKDVEEMARAFLDTNTICDVKKHINCPMCGKPYTEEDMRADEARR